MEKHLNAFIGEYANDVRNGNAAVFVGAGLSIPAGFVNWKNLLREIAEDLKLNIDLEHDLISVAQWHCNEKGNKRNKLNKILIDEFTQKGGITVNHRILASLPIQTYWTTNYDKLIEKAIELEGKTVDVKITQENLATNISKRDAILYKMHGDVSFPDQAVLTKDDYEGYNEKRSLFTMALQGDLISKTFLFIGFSFDDPNLGYILSRIRILLGQNSRDHYFFLKNVDRSDFKTDAEFNYAETKQQLKISDLKRYSINALVIKNYDQITQVLTGVSKKVLRSNILISGAADDFTPRSIPNSLSLVHTLSYRLASCGYKVITGITYEIGSAIINGVTDYVFSTTYRHLDDSLLLRPFPKIVTGTKTKDERYFEWRKDMLGHAGVAIFIFGNKFDGNGGLIHSPGMIQEFEISVKYGVVPIPIGATGYASRELWEIVTKDKEKYYPNDATLFDIIDKLGDVNLSDDELLDYLFGALTILQREL